MTSFNEPAIEIMLEMDFTKIFVTNPSQACRGLLQEVGEIDKENCCGTLENGLGQQQALIHGAESATGKFRLLFNVKGLLNVSKKLIQQR